MLRRNLRFIAAQEQRAIRNIFRRTQCIPRMLSRNRIPRLRVSRQRRNHRALSKPRTKAVDVDAILGIVERHLFRHTNDRMLRYEWSASRKPNAIDSRVAS